MVAQSVPSAALAADAVSVAPGTGRDGLPEYRFGRW
jgi:hypothetical protein